MFRLIFPCAYCSLSASRDGPGVSLNQVWFFRSSSRGALFALPMETSKKPSYWPLVSGVGVVLSTLTGVTILGVLVVGRGGRLDVLAVEKSSKLMSLWMKSISVNSLVVLEGLSGGGAGTVL